MIHQNFKPTTRGCGPALRYYVPIAMATNPQTGERTIAEQRTFNDALQAIIKALKPIIHKQIQRKRLGEHMDDATQAAYIAILRALQDYDPTKSQFQTHFVWKLNEQLKKLDEQTFSYERKQDTRRRIEADTLDDSFNDMQAYSVEADSIENHIEENLSHRNLKNILSIFQKRAKFLASRTVTTQKGSLELSAQEITQALDIMHQCLVMRDLQQKSFDEIFETLGVPRQRAKTILDYMHKELAAIALASLKESAAKGTNLLGQQDHVYWLQENQKQSRKILNMIVGLQKDMQQPNTNLQIAA